MSKGVAVKVTDLEKKSCRVQCFNKHTWNVRKGMAYRVVPAGYQGEETELYEVPVRRIFDQIKFVWFKGKLVASWNGEVVVTTCDNKFLEIRSKKSDRIKSELIKQAFRDAVEYDNWLEETIYYWHHDSEIRKELDEKKRIENRERLEKKEGERRKKMLDQAAKLYSKLDRKEFQSWVSSIQEAWYTKKDKYS